MRNPSQSPPSSQLSQPAAGTRSHTTKSIFNSANSVITSRFKKGALLFTGMMILIGTSNAQSSIAGWDFSTLTGGTNNFGPSPLAPSASSPNLTIVGLTRGSGVGTTNTGAAGAWGGNSWDEGTDYTTALSSNNFVTFSVTPNIGSKLSLASVSAYNVRKSGSGPTTGQWQYSVDGTTFTDIGTAITWGAVTNNVGNTQTLIDLSAVSALQDLAAGTTVTFRVVNWNSGNSPTSGGTWYLNNFQTGNDLDITGTITPVGTDLPPSFTSLSPTDDSTAVLAGSNLVVAFSENVVTIPASTGKIELRKKSDNSLIQDFAIGSTSMTLNGNILTLNPSADLAYLTEFYVTIPAGFLEDATGNDFPGILTNTAWTFTTEATPPPPVVVVNKIYNSGVGSGVGDAVELLVTGNGTTGTFADLSGMFVKDFSTSVTGDNGAQYQFATGSIWSSVPVGTLIVLTRSAESPDVTSADFSISVGLDDPTYFAKTGGTFDIAAQEMIMIKTAASGASGIAGNIHAIAGTDGISAATLFEGTIAPKLISTTTIGPSAGVIATNPTSSIADFNGTNASTVALTVSALGNANNTENLVYINALRGIIPGDGSGQSTILNATAGSFSGLNIFDDAQTDNQSVKLSLTAQVPSVTLTTVEITVPAGMGVPSGASVTGAGSGTPVIGISSQVVTISGLAITNTNLIDITLTGLDTPTTTVSDTGRQSFIVKTAIASGTLKNILTQPVANVIIPIEAIRDVNPATGVALDLNAVVAVEGVCTEAQVYTTNTLAYLQDGNFGVAVFNSNPNGNPFIAGQRFAVVGTVAQFSGVTQVAVTSFANVVNLGAGTSPTPLVITIPQLLLTPEAYEGRLVTVENLSPAVWSAPVSPATSVTVSMQDTASPVPNPLTILITNGSGALTGPGGSANITGIFSQNDGSSPFDTGYQLLPREADDVDPLVSGYGAWIATYYPGVTDVNIVGFGADPDKDGIANGVESLIGGDPTAPGVFATSELEKNDNVFTFLYPQDSVVPVGIDAAYQWSTDMVTWHTTGQSAGGVTVSITDQLWDNSDPEITIYQVTATVTAGTAAKLFVRVGATD
ncbi:MAG: Ig-like domain-containing protein [Verrucomicrobiota bacterium]